MKVSEILESGMVNDNTVICIDLTTEDGLPNFNFKGGWYTDNIMGCADAVITKLTYIKAENKIYIEAREEE